MTLFINRRPPVDFHPSEDFQSSKAAVRLDGVKARALETGRARLLIASMVFVVAYGGIGLRMLDVAVLERTPSPAKSAQQPPVPGDDMVRADIVDRNGEVLATSLPTVSLYAKTSELLDTQDAAEKLASVLPDLDVDETQERLSSAKAFAYLRRNLTPRQEYDVNALGIPGLYFEKGERRVYPHGNLSAHVVGITDIDNQGLSGIEKRFEERLTNDHSPLHLSLDIRMQTIVHNELATSVDDFKALGWIYIPYAEAPDDLLECLKEGDYIGIEQMYQGCDTLFLNGGLTGQIFFYGVALTPEGKETAARVGRIMAAKDQVVDISAAFEPIIDFIKKVSGV